MACYRLEGIPKEYDPYLRYIEGEGAGAIMRAVRETLELPEEERLMLAVGPGAVCSLRTKRLKSNAAG